MNTTTTTAPVRNPISDTRLIRADQVVVGDRVGRFGDRVTKVITSDGITSIAIDTPHGYSISEDRSDRRIQIAPSTAR